MSSRRTAALDFRYTEPCMGWLFVFVVATLAALGWKSIEHKPVGTAASWFVASALVLVVVFALFMALRLGFGALA